MVAGARGAVGAKGHSGKTSNIPKFEAKELPSIKDSQFKGKLNDLEDLGDEITRLAKKRKALDEEIKVKSAMAMGVMAEVNDKESWSVRGDGWTACFVKPKPRKTLVLEKLIEMGVALKVIEKATVKTEVSPFVTFQVPKDEE